jgi:hypothetical protein
MIWMVGALLMLSTQAASLGCSSSDSTVSCDENGCECADRTNCDLDCMDVAACQPSCTSIDDTCQATCTVEDCEFRCISAERCEGLCGDNCRVVCSGSQGICRAETGNNSQYNCTNVRTCLLTDTCMVECIEGERLDCGQGLITCGMPCPEAEPA